MVSRKALKEDGRHIACIGGGTGLYTILSGLKEEDPDAHLAAVVSMMDNGGSTGRLRDEFGYLPPGDVRRCLLALSSAPQHLRSLMQYRFGQGDGLRGHVLGNLMLTALKETLDGTPEEREYKAIEAMEQILSIRGKVYPVTLTDCHVAARLSNGSVVRGETNIDIPKHDPALKVEDVWLEPRAAIFPKTRDALVRADAIIIGPGDLFSSIMPNLVVDGMAQALKDAKSRGAKILYVANTMTKRGETDGYSASTFAERVQEKIDGALLDGIIVNTGEISPAQERAYAHEHAYPVADDLDGSRWRVFTGDLVSTDAFARHHPRKLAKAALAALATLEGA
jgi:uncharacterized cofD-like protein